MGKYKDLEDFGHNQVRSLKGLEGLNKLEEVWASYDLIADFNEVEQVLRNKEELTTVYFEGNPLQLRAPALYRNKVKLALPQIKQIDASECSRPNHARARANRAQHS